MSPMPPRFRRGRRLFLAASLLCALFAAPLPAADTPDESLAGPALLSALRAGGLILYFRHTSTDFGQNDDQMSGYEDCARQRNLTDRGRDEARAIGAAIQRLRIPVGDVLATEGWLERARTAVGSKFRPTE